jgi:hypothetical protein
MNILGIDGQADMKLIFGTTAAEEKGKVGKEDKVIFYLLKKNGGGVVGVLGFLRLFLTCT